MSEANLTSELRCHRVNCGGELMYIGDASGDTLYQCDECEASLSQSATRELADRDGAVGELARTLLEGV